MKFSLKKPETIAPAPVKALHDVLAHGDSARIEEAVRLAEHNSSSEIIVKLSAATDDGEMRGIAEAEFVRLGLPGLSPSNGILIYVSLNRRAVEIVVGPDAASQLPDDLWRTAAAAVADGFRREKAADGIIAAVDAMAAPLAQVFPPLETPGPELPNVSEGP